MGQFNSKIIPLEHTALSQAYTALAAAAGVFQDTFARLHAQRIVPDVLYPAVQVPSDDDLEVARSQWQQHLSSELARFATAAPLFVSINRFERKKVGICIAVMHCLWTLTCNNANPSCMNVMFYILAFLLRTVCFRNRVYGMNGLTLSFFLQGLPLAIQALHELNQQAENNHFSKAHLVVAGGYDKRLAENREHFNEISKLINDLGMTNEVLLLLSAS